jgi:hypothetical protein
LSVPWSFPSNPLQLPSSSTIISSSFSFSISVPSLAFLPTLYCTVLYCTLLYCSRAFPPPILHRISSCAHQSLLINCPSLATKLFISYLRNSSSRFFPTLLCSTILPGAIARVGGCHPFFSSPIPHPGQTRLEPSRELCSVCKHPILFQHSFRRTTRPSIETYQIHQTNYSPTVALLHFGAHSSTYLPTPSTILPLLALHVSLPTTLPATTFLLPHRSETASA